MIVYLGPREASGGGVRSCCGVWGSTPAFVPNSTVNRPVCTASVPSLPGCPGSPLPETTIAWASPGPMMRAWEGPFASAGVARVIAAAMLMAAARAVTTVSLRSIGAAPFQSGLLLLHRRPVPRSRGPAASARRTGDREGGCLAEVAFQAQRDLPGGPDQRVAGGEPGGGDGGCAAAGDVH